MSGSGKATILVTGAAGKTGRAVVRTLARRGMRARALVFRERQATGIQALGATEVVVGDLRSRDDLERAVGGIRALYHICPNVHPQEVEIGE